MNTVKCPNCGNENLSTNIRCEKCGKQLITEDQMQTMDLKPSLNIQQNPVQDAKIESFAEVFSGIWITIVGAIFSVGSSMFVFKGVDNITKIAGIPFLICGIAAVLIDGISMIIKGINTKKNTNDYVNGKLNMDKVKKSEKNFKKVRNIVNYIYIFCFLLFWFGFLIVFDTVAIKSWSDGGNSMFFSSLIFWAVGIYILINNIKKSKKKANKVKYMSV